MSFLVETFARSLALLLVAALVAFALRKGSAALRHRLWALAFVGLTALPFLALSLPEWQIERPVRFGHSPHPSAPVRFRPSKVAPPVSDDSLTVPSPALDSPSPWPRLFVTVWAIGVATSLASTAWGLAGLARFGRRGVDLPTDPALGVPPHTHVVRTSVGVPMTLGFLRPLILLPEASQHWEDERRRMVLLHEGAHVQRGDWAWLVLARLIVALYWPNPLAWLAAAQMRAEAERAADDAVLSAGIGADRYAETLVDFAAGLRGRPAVAAIPFVECGTLKARVAAVLRETRRTPLRRRTAVAVLLLGIAIVFPCAAARLVPSPTVFQDGVIDLGKDGRIEVVAITSIDGGRPVSWNAQGTVLPQPYAINSSILDWFRQTAPAIPGGSVARYVVLRGVLADGASIPTFSDRLGGEILPQIGDHGPQPDLPFGIQDTDDADFRVVRLTVPRDQTRGRMVARFATGSWRHDFWFNFKNGELSGTRGTWVDPRLTPALRTKPWKSEFSFDLPESFRNRMTRVVPTPGGGGNLMQGRVGRQQDSLDTSAESIRTIEISSRPLASAMLDDLPLSPRSGATYRSRSIAPEGTLVAQNGNVQLPDGSILSVESVWDAAKPGSVAWDAAGRPLPHRPTDRWLSDGLPVQVPNFQARRFRLIRTGNAENAQVFVYDGEGLLTPLGNPSSLHDGKGTHEDFTALVGPNRVTMSLLLKLATTPYRTTADGTLGLTKGYRAFTRKGMAGPATFTAEFPRALLAQMEGVDATLKPLDENGKEVRNANGTLSSSRTTSDGGENVVEFDLPPDRARRVKRLALRVRPFTWVRFPDVPLDLR